ncbi:DUF2207 domain-containing protein [Rhodohalobacter halophilus]|uniref:DUF2207 domain-containing protein n=1 Tax=Rhodohalobacter halophilus TaxID=1812810 RepID=UPI00083FD58E|nr:DUF2207 domain-containing protein [Rhodohalobacter halophilus]
MTKILLSLLFMMVPLYQALAQDYSMPEINVQVIIQENGTVSIEESRTYNYRGTFSWADYRLPKRGFSEIRDIRVSEDDDFYINENSEETGTFSVSESDDLIVIKWHYDASDEIRTFTIHYELENAISIGPEYSEFYWIFIGDGRDKVVGRSEVSIQLPGQTSADSLYSWNYSSASDSELIESESGFTLTSGRVNRNQNVAIRALFPTNLFQSDLIEISDPNLDLSQIIQEEAEYDEMLQRQAERDAFFAEIATPVTILLSLLSFGIFFFCYQRFGKRHSTATISNRETVVLPDRTPPAIIGRLMSSRHTTGNHLVATIFDLARRGWFNIEEQEKEASFLSSAKSEFYISVTDNEPDEELPKWEQMVYSFVKSRTHLGSTSFEKLFTGSSSKVAKWFHKWKKEVKQVFDEKGWIDQNSYTGVYINVAGQILIDIASIILLILAGPIAIISLVIAFIFSVASIAIIRHTKEGEEKFQRWKAYRDGLKNADERTIRMELLDVHFVYATALHLSKKQLDNLIQSSYDTNTDHLFRWIKTNRGSSHSPATAAAALATLASTSSSSFSSASGSSGGASTGSAGGGATGGAG